MATWPPTLADLKVELRVEDQRDDPVMARKLAAAISYVERVKADPDLGYFVPPHDVGSLVEGTLLLASRLYARRNSPDGLVAMGELGSTNVPGFDADIDRALEIGRYGGSFTV
jgi:hypothetical protein